MAFSQPTIFILAEVTFVSFMNYTQLSSDSLRPLHQGLYQNGRQNDSTMVAGGLISLIP